MKTFPRHVLEVQRSDFQPGANPSSVTTLNECLLWTPWTTTGLVVHDSRAPDWETVTLAREIVRKQAKAARETTEWLRPGVPTPRFRIVRVVSECTVLEEGMHDCPIGTPAEVPYVPASL